MYSWNNKTEPISARLAPGLKERIDFECLQHDRCNRNRFLNDSAEMMLNIIYEVRCGNIDPQMLPRCIKIALVRYHQW